MAFGGFTLDQTPIRPEHALHRAMALKSDCTPAPQRAQAPEKHVFTSNLLVRRDVLRASKVMADRAAANPKIDIRWHTEVDEVIGMVRLVYKERVSFYRGDADFAPGISLHHIGGHTKGLQCVRVHTARGWVVVASDTSHYYEHFEQGRVFTTTFHLGDTLDGYARLKQLADSIKHIVPGHDPLVMQRYPAVSKELEGIAVRLDAVPNY